MFATEQLIFVTLSKDYLEPFYMLDNNYYPNENLFYKKLFSLYHPS
ncbi:hypothetical protein BDCR2A_01439 [Borrelia duttonii CR2A]|uniref:Uncharacterized protein n=1 Tax=Borrelia duttonii CR2A TaxID=1432657 RepID=W6TGX3_9SPIR|nr:hypothetical protein BDCR2A_01439 [Borrelia duttonii CR2A]